MEIIAAFNDRTGYGIHASNFFPRLQALRPNSPASIVLSTTDSQAFYNPHKRPVVAYNVWETTRYPDKFFKRLLDFDQLWVASNWQRNCVIEQGYPAEKVKVVPEGIDPEMYKPWPINGTSGTSGAFTFAIFGKWEDRKYTKELIHAWIECAKPWGGNVRLLLSADNPFPVDKFTTTEQRLEAYGLNDPRIQILHFPPKEEYVSRLKSIQVFLSCSRAEGWNLPLIEAIACGVPSVYSKCSGQLEFTRKDDGSYIGIPVKTTGEIKPFNVYQMPDCPGFWYEPDYEDLKRAIRQAYTDYSTEKIRAHEDSKYIHSNFTWDKAAEKAATYLDELDSKDIIFVDPKICEKPKDDVVVIGCWPDTEEKLTQLQTQIDTVKAAGFDVAISTHFPLPLSMYNQADYYVYDMHNELAPAGKGLVYWKRNGDKEEMRPAKNRYHAVAVLTTIRNAIRILYGRYKRLHFIEFDIETDISKYVQAANDQMAKGAEYVAFSYETTGMSTCIMSVLMDRWPVFPEVDSWDKYAEMHKGEIILENWLLQYIAKMSLPVALLDPLEFPFTNKFDQIERDIWDGPTEKALPQANLKVSYNFVDGCFFEVLNNGGAPDDLQLTIELGNKDTKEIIDTVRQTPNNWFKTNVKYYVPWTLRFKMGTNDLLYDEYSAENQNVMICLESKALGDNLAWMPYLDEFSKQHKCNVKAVTFFNHLFKDNYPNIQFFEPGATVENLYAAYRIGCYDYDVDRNPMNWRVIPMQQIATDILGLEYKEVKPLITVPQFATGLGNKYVCISEHATLFTKYWQYDNGWQEIVDYLKSLGYDVVAISSEMSQLNGIIDRTNKPLEQTMTTLRDADFYIGVGSGPAWLAWALDVPVVMISGFSKPYTEFQEGNFRVFNDKVCNGCFNDPTYPYERGRWDWCPRKKKFECSRSITPAMVKAQIDKIREVQCAQS
jgi:autotransporter strand-loop-strand O-heptosyltransferase